MTITDLLLTTEYMGNQSKLAIDLKINRGTLRQYMADTEGNHHFVSSGNLYTNQTNKIQNKGGK